MQQPRPLADAVPTEASTAELRVMPAAVVVALGAGVVGILPWSSSAVRIVSSSVVAVLPITANRAISAVAKGALVGSMSLCCAKLCNSSGSLRISNYCCSPGPLYQRA